MKIERRKVPRDKTQEQDRDGAQWLSTYAAQPSPSIRLRMLQEREAALRGMPSQPTLAEQLAWIARERESVVKQIGVN